MEFRAELPLEGVISFYQSIDRFWQYCSMCRKLDGEENEDQRIACAIGARESIDNAYAEYLINIPLIFAMVDGVKPMSLSAQLDTEELKSHFQRQLESIDRKEEMWRYLDLLNILRRMCPFACNFEEVEEGVKGLLELAGAAQNFVEMMYVDVLVEETKGQLKDMVKNPEAFRSMFPLPPKPLEDEYRS
jgi:hypothetical protein